MAWDHLSINKPHLAYTILGGFTTVFMLVSLFIKEKLYIGEATVATICGIIFGPSGLGWFDPASWGNVDQITLEASRIVLVVQCFAVGVELPKKYMTRHWKSVVFLLIPVMTWGWLVTSVFIWWMIPPLTWLESLTCAACVTATDPVLASSVVGKGKFARRIPKHLRDLLSAESGCNDGMAFPFIYLSLYLIDYRPDATKVFEHWFILTVLYECVFGAFYGVCVGYAGRHAIKWAEKKGMIDRESFLVFYFVLALWCAGTGSMLGVDDLLVGFCAGVAFSNDGWFAQKTEESHVSNVIDLLLNLAYFVYFGSIVPWSTYNRPDWGITPWRLVVIAIFVIFFRRIPIMVALKPLIPDIKTWREALFAGHFGPIGVGAIFVAILARAELETGDTTPLSVLPKPNETKHYMVIELIWPITTFLVISSIVVHGSSIAVFTLGKHVNTMRITMSYTTANEEPNWLTRLPRLTPRPSMSIRKPDIDDSSEEKLGTSTDGLFPPGTLPPPGGVAGGFLNRDTSGRDDSPAVSRPSSIKAKRRKNWEAGRGPGGPISDTAIAPRRRRTGLGTPVPSPGLPAESPMIPEPAVKKEHGFEMQPAESKDSRLETYQEGHNIIVENEEGEVLSQGKTPPHESEKEGPLDTTNFPGVGKHQREGRLTSQTEVTDERSALAAAGAEQESSGKPRKREPAWAYRFDDNIIVEDDDGEVIKRYKIPKQNRPESSRKPSAGGWGDWGEWVGMFGRKGKGKAHSNKGDDDFDAKTIYSDGEEERNAGIRWRMHDESGRKMSKQEFLAQLQQMDPHARAAVGEKIGLQNARSEDELAQGLRAKSVSGGKGLPEVPATVTETRKYSQPSDTSTDTVVGESQSSPRPAPAGSTKGKPSQKPSEAWGEETSAERKRREMALGITENDNDSDDDGEDRVDCDGIKNSGPVTARVSPAEKARSPGIRFAVQGDSPPSSSSGGNTPVLGNARGTSLIWGEDVGKGKGKEV